MVIVTQLIAWERTRVAVLCGVIRTWSRVSLNNGLPHLIDGFLSFFSPFLSSSRSSPQIFPEPPKAEGSVMEAISTRTRLKKVTPLRSWTDTSWGDVTSRQVEEALKRIFEDYIVRVNENQPDEREILEERVAKIQFHDGEGVHRDGRRLGRRIWPGWSGSLNGESEMGCSREGSEAKELLMILYISAIMSTWIRMPDQPVSSPSPTNTWVRLRLSSLSQAVHEAFRFVSVLCSARLHRWYSLETLRILIYCRRQYASARMKLSSIVMS